MKVFSCSYPLVNQAYINKSGLKYNNHLSCDVFERKNVSFGQKEKDSKTILIKYKGFSEKQANAIISAGLDQNSFAKIRFLIMQGNEFDTVIKILKNVPENFRFTKDERAEDTIKKYYLSGEKQLERYQRLSEDKELDVIDKIAIVGYGLESFQVEKYKSLGNQPMDLYERLLAAKFMLSKEKIKTYLSKKGKSIPYLSKDNKVLKYIPTADELMLCIRENFSANDFLYFASAKAQVRDFEKQTVRKSGGEVSLSTAQIIIDVLEERRRIEALKKSFLQKIEKLENFHLTPHKNIVMASNEVQKLNNLTNSPAIRAEKMINDKFELGKKEEVILTSIKNELRANKKIEDMLSGSSLKTKKERQETKDLLNKIRIKASESIERNAKNTEKMEASGEINYIDRNEKFKKTISELTNFVLPVVIKNQVSKEIVFNSDNNIINQQKAVDYARSLVEITRLNATLRKKIEHSSFLESLPSDFWYKIVMDCDVETHDVIKKAIMNNIISKDKDITSAPLRNINIPLLKPSMGHKTVLYSENSDYTLKSNGDFVLNSSNPFDVNVSQCTIDDKSVLFITDNNTSNKYVAYNGAIAQVDFSRTFSPKQFEPWSNLLPEKQSIVLATAANDFIFNLFDEDENLIIGQNAPVFDVKEKTDDELKHYYSEKLLKLKENNEFTTRNILKLMPKGTMLAIYPYIQNNNILYSIVSEWFSKDGNRWQMEVHSQDLNWNDDENWIFRLHKQEGNDRQYFQFVENEDGYDFNGGFLDENAHIKVKTPLSDDNLLNNVEFQSIIRQISTNLYERNEINKLAKNLGVSGKNENEKMIAIVNHCLKNPLDFTKYNDEILQIRNKLGLLNFADSLT